MWTLQINPDNLQMLSIALENSLAHYGRNDGSGRIQTELARGVPEKRCGSMKFLARISRFIR